MLKRKETEQGRELAGLQQDLEQRMKVVDEVSRHLFCIIFFSTFYFISNINTYLKHMMHAKKKF